MSTTHTPGPWDRNIRPASRYPIIFAGRNTHVAQVCTRGLSEAEQEANCNLIAAAPELLAALQALLADKYLADPINADRMAQARAAIARATNQPE